MNSPAKLKWVYALMVVFIGLSSVQMGIFVTHQTAGDALQCATIPYVIIDLFIGYTLVRMLWRIVAQSFLTRKWLRLFRSSKHDKLTKRLNHKYRSFGTEIIIIQDEAFVALTIGMRRPVIVISTAVLDRFNDDEVKAILLHEWHHCLKRDNRKMFLTKLLAEAYGYWPMMKPIQRYAQTCVELLADRFAIRRMGTELHLASVLLQLAKLGKVRQHAAAVHFASATMHYRMLQVLEPDRPLTVKASLVRPVLLSFTILMLLVLGGDT